MGAYMKTKIGISFLCLILVSCTNFKRFNDHQTKIVCPHYKIETSSALLQDNMGRYMVMTKDFLVVIPPTCVIMIPLLKQQMEGKFNEKPKGIRRSKSRNI